MPNLATEQKKTDQPTTLAVDPAVYQLPGEPRRRGGRWWWPMVALLVVVVFIGLGFLTKMVMAINSTNAETGKRVGFFEQVRNLLVNPEDQLKGTGQDRINILLAGIGGAGHDGAYLADTIILVSIQPSTGAVATMSIPRDLLVEIPGYGWRKVNNATAFGRTDGTPGGGEALLSQVVSTVTSQTIHYYARSDFEGFRRAIDDLGGIDVYVDNPFTDTMYPDYSYGYQTISFTHGWEFMSGERALQFARSRHGCCGEGSDFARSRRQQKVLVAMKGKFLSMNSLINPSAIVTALNNIGSHNQTNLQLWEVAKLLQVATGVTQDSIITQVLDTGTDGLLTSATGADGAYILQPKSGDFRDIQQLAATIFSSANITREKARIQIQNGTSQTGLATKTAERLRALRYDVVNVSNTAGTVPLKTTTIYDLSGGTKPYTISSLQKLLQAEVTASRPATIAAPTGNANRPTNQLQNVNQATEPTDILIIVGSDQVTPQVSTTRPAT
ncbi:MAG: LCP family protein [Patescibacteria group bacterium]